MIIGFIGIMAPFLFKRLGFSKTFGHIMLIVCSLLMGAFVFIGAIVYDQMLGEWLPGAYGAPQSYLHSFVFFLAGGFLALFSGCTFLVGKLEEFLGPKDMSFNRQRPRPEELTPITVRPASEQAARAAAGIDPFAVGPLDVQ